MEPKTIYQTKIKLPSTEQVLLDDKVLTAIWSHRGKENRIGRAELVQEVFGVKVSNAQLANNRMDRQIRESIERLRRKYVIISSSGLNGYWFPETEAEAQAFITETENRAMKLLQITRTMRSNVEAQFQPKLQETLF